MITCEHLDITFGRGDRAVNAVSDVSFDVAEGESYGLVGESGSGKSTVLRAIAGLVRHWQGRIVVNNQALSGRRSKEACRMIQMVFQDPYGSLHPRHTVDHILKEPLRIHGMGDEEDRITRALDEVGLDRSFRFRFPHQLSGGQRQRVAIARALIIEPKVLLLDEPTSALDVSIQAEVLNLLSRLRRDHGLTYLLVSHDLAVISHSCDRLSVMRESEILETMPVTRLRTGAPEHGYTKQLFRAAEGYDRSAGQSPR